MGLVNDVVGGMEGGGLGSSGPLSSVLGSLLGQSQGSAQGLGGLLGQMRQAGLGHIVESWVGNGANQPVTSEQLHGALGDQQVQSMANQAGMQPHDLLAQLAQSLPRVVDSLTPNGQMPADQQAGGSLHV